MGVQTIDPEEQNDQNARDFFKEIDPESTLNNLVTINEIGAWLTKIK